jgi:hypothetical protein
MGGVLGGILGLGSSLLGNLGAKQRQKQADAQNIKFWQMQNAYNTPAQQMARLKKAGLNPALLYGSGSANTGVAGAVAPSKPAPYNIKNPIPDILQSAMLKSQIELQNSQAGKNRAEERRTLGMTPYQINSAMSKADQARQRAIIETVNAYVVGAQKQDKINELAEKVLILKAQKKLEQAKATFKAGMYNININPDAPVYNAVFQNIFSKASNFMNETLPSWISKASGVDWNN